MGNCVKCGYFINDQMPKCAHCGEPYAKEQESPWNWGAFLMGPIWGIRFRVWKAIPLSLFLGIIGAFINGYYGTKWAWDKRENDNVEAFNKLQNKWMRISIIGTILYVVIVILSILVS